MIIFWIYIKYKYIMMISDTIDYSLEKVLNGQEIKIEEL